MNKIGFSLLAADHGSSTKLLLGADETRLDSRLACTRQVSAAIELDAPGEYSLIPYTEEPQTFMPYTLTVASTAPLQIAPVPKPPPPTLLRGAWSAAKATAGGCPNNVDSWTGNPQYVLKTAGPVSYTHLTLPTICSV